MNEKDKIIYLDGTPVGKNQDTYIIAEIGQNHNGDIKIAKQLIDMAVRCGANAVKFQKRDMSCELTKDAFETIYDNPNSFGKTYGEHRLFLELNEEQHKELSEYARKAGITYFCTPCDIPSVELLERVGCPFYKIASRDLSNIPLLEKLGMLNKPILISTGMADYDDIDYALKSLQRIIDKVIIMHCTSEYPCKMENANLKAIQALINKYDHLVGFSDHTSGIIASAVAPIFGAVIIEKHITLNRAMKGSDQAGSLEEAGLRKLINYIQAIKVAQGNGEKIVIEAVLPAKYKLSRSITSKINISKGTKLTEDMIILKSPGTGLKWVEKDKLLGKTAKQDISSDITLTEELFS